MLHFHILLIPDFLISIPSRREKIIFLTQVVYTLGYKRQSEGQSCPELASPWRPSRVQNTDQLQDAPKLGVGIEEGLNEQLCQLDG